MKPTIPGPTLAAYGDPTSPRLVVWYAGTDQDARMEGGACPAYLSAFLAAGCFVVRVAPTVEGEDGRQWTYGTAMWARDSAMELWDPSALNPECYFTGFSNGTTGACWAAGVQADGLALLCGSGLTQPVDPSVPVYLGFGSRDRKIDKATRIARADAWRQHSGPRVVVATHDHYHEVHEAHLPEVLATFGLVTP